MKRWLIGAGALVALAVAAVAQTVVTFQFTGTELLRFQTTSGGQDGLTQINSVRGGIPSAIVTITGAHTIGTGNSSVLSAGGNLLVIAQPAAAVLTLPANPLTNGATVGVCNTSAGAWATNAVTLIANTNQSIATGTVTLTTLAAFNCVHLHWNTSNSTWYRTR